MPPDELTAVEALGVAIRAEIGASELYAELATRVLNPFLQQKILLLSKEELQHKRILEGAYNAQFPEVPLVLPSTQLAKQTASASPYAKFSPARLRRNASRANSTLNMPSMRRT